MHPLFLLMPFMSILILVQPDSSAPDECSTIPPSFLSLLAVGINSRLRTLVDSGSSHCFLSKIICELNRFVTYAVPSG
jgi:hypothetical protein